MITLNGDTGITTPTYGGAVAAEYIAPVTAFKNRIINGAMMIDQRNAGASVTVPNTNVTPTWAVDRWRMLSTQASKFSVQQNAGAVTPPVGFTNYLGSTSLSAYSVTSTDVFANEQYIEGLNVADLGWGTANAAPVTLSFWVRSSLTGAFGGALRNSANNRSYPFTYTISAANTWEQKSVTIAGDTSGTWLTTNGVGIVVSLGLGAGSTFSGTAGAWAAGYFFSATGATSVVGTNGATFYITGVQLEKGSTATSFDYRPYGAELALAQRYFQSIPASAFNASANLAFSSGNTLYATYSLPVIMRASPTIIGTGATYSTQNVTGSIAYASSVAHIRAGINSAAAGNTFFIGTSGNVTAGIEL
jgi:hypothetical protein